MKYLRGTIDYDILYNEFLVVLERYSDANQILNLDGIKSTSDYIFILNGGVMSWKSLKQSLITRSTMESKFITLE